MSLTIRDDAKREIQKDVDALTKSQRYFNLKVDRARTYFPIIEKIFKEEQLPDDFKYLVLQESSLTPDAVSPSNAVGFWQFKDFTAQEMGMRVDRDVDERMNIVSSSHGAAKYIKANNWYFNNWVLALQAYQMGKGGVIEALGDKYNGDSHMEINSETYWYVKKFLAHKIAFQEACDGRPQTTVGLYEPKGKKRLSDIADEVSVDVATLKEYNKWIKNGVIPDDKAYFVSIPGGSIPEDFNTLVLNSPKSPIVTTATVKGTYADDIKFHVNGVLVIKALPGEVVSSISKRADLDPAKFIALNDISIDARIKPGAYYFVKKKRKKSAFSVYQTKEGDDLWQISQQQGIQLKYLKRYNAGLADKALQVGTLVKLNNNKSAKPELLDDNTEIAEVGEEPFAWSIQPVEKKKVVTKEEQPKEPPISLNPHAPASEVSVDTTLVAKSQQPSNQTEIIVYEVKPSDTLYSIARQFGATIKDVMEWNNKSTLTINPGEKLKIVKR
jgi:membrane-bound lytic murein transglycosylase D